jgi:hypothetical protein
LQEKGYEVAILSRSSHPDSETISYTWDIDRHEIDREAINNCEYIIHLAGINIGEKRWSDGRKKEISNSRIKSTQLIFNNIDRHNHQLKAFISASAVGYYGTSTSEKIFRETDVPGSDFLGQICKEWEHAADQFTSMGVRTVKIRTGIVLSKEGGALSKLVVPVRWGVGSAIGRGNQYMPWIHLDDLCAIYIQAMENQAMTGAYNAVAPEHITNKAFTAKVARAIHRPFWFPNIPGFVMKLLFGEMSVMLLTGSRISSEKIAAAGYTFHYPHLDGALKEIYTREK